MDGQENSSTPSQPNTSGNKMVIPVVIAAVIILGIVGIFAYQGMQSQSNGEMVKNQVVNEQTITPSQTPTQEQVATSGAETTGNYKNGTYKVTGNYVSPGGPREVEVTLTLKDGVVTQTDFKGLATDATSKRFQGEFADGYEVMVVGKNIDEISLTKVSGSSLTPKGFMDAVEKIKVEANQA